MLILVSMTILGLGLLLMPTYVNAGTVKPCDITFCIGGLDNTRYSDTGLTQGQRANNIIVDIAALLTFVIASIAVIFAVYSGFRMLTSDGDAKKFEEARSGLIYAVVGLVVAVLSYGIIASIIGVLSSLRIG